MGSKTKKNLVMRIITTPYRLLCKAKDFYIRSITDCANHNTYGRAAMTLPRSYSTTSFGSRDSAADDLRELIRANSTARIGDLNINREELELYIKQHVMRQSGRIVPRSASVGMGRIDENGPISSFPDENRTVKSEGLVFPRSKSHGVLGF